MKNDMATFVLTLDWTDQGIRNLREAPKRSEAAKAIAKRVGVEIKEIYLTTGSRVTPDQIGPIGSMPMGTPMLFHTVTAITACRLVAHRAIILRCRIW